MPEIMIISRLPIRLGQFLKLAEIVSDGGEAATLIAGGDVAVNALPERRRGRKLLAGDTVEVGGRTFLIVSKADRSQNEHPSDIPGMVSPFADCKE